MGQDIFKESFQPKAYIATYQDLGLIKDNYLTVISPRKKVCQYSLRPQKSELPANFKLYYDEAPLKISVQNLIDDCVSVYQSTSYRLQKNQLNK